MVIATPGVVTNAPEDIGQELYRQAFDTVKSQIIAEPFTNHEQARRALEVVIQAYKERLLAAGYTAQIHLVEQEVTLSKMEAWRRRMAEG